MALQAIIFLLLGVVILILVVINAFLLKYFYQTNQKIDKLLENGKIKDFKDIFLSQKEKNDGLEENIKDAFLKIKNLEDTCETTIRKIGVVRFNPFNDMGGNQSFAIALLDNKNNGFLISSLFGKDGSRVYTKTIKQGKSDY
jgi:cell division protein FtsB